MTKTVVMNRNVLCKNILDECKNGNFEKTLSYIDSSLEENIPCQIAMNILICCCNACVNKKDDISEESLIKVLRKVLPFLEDVCESDFLSYMQSIFHVIKFFIYKNSLESIVQLEEIRSLNFQPSRLSSRKHILVYQKLATILHNAILKYEITTDKHSNEVIFKLSILMIHIYMKCMDFLGVINLAAGCFSKLIKLKLEVQYQIEYYKIILNSLDYSQVKPKCESVFNHIQDFSCIILNNILSNLDFENGIQFLNTIATLVQKVLKHEEYTHLHQMLRYFLVVKLDNKSSEIDQCMESLLKLDEIWKNKMNCRQKLIQNIYKLLQTIKDYYISCPNEWQVFSENLQLQIIKFIIKMNSFQDSTLITVDTKKKYYGLYYLNMIVSLIKINNINNSLEYHQKCVNMLSTFFNKLFKFNQFENLHHVAGEIYYFGFNLHQNLNKAATLYFLLLIQYFVKLKDIHGAVFLKYAALQSICKMLINMFSEDNNKCLGYISLAAFLCNKDKEFFMAKWVTLKYNLKHNEDIQNLNVVSALELLQEDILELTLNTSDKLYLLNMELEYYKKRWRSKIPIICTIKKLFHLSDNDSIARTIVNIFIDIDLPHNDEVHDALGNLLNTYKKANTATSIVNIAVLNYIYYKNCRKIIILKNADDMEKVASVIPLKQETNPLEPSDPSDECDVASSFDSLRLDAHKENLKNLELSLATLDSLVPELKSDDFEHVKLSQLYTLLLEIYSEFKLSCFKVKAVKALELSLQIAQVLNDVPCIIKSIGLIIEQMDLTEERSKSLMKFADTLLETKDPEQSDNLEMCILYYICKSKALLYNNYQESYSIFKKAKYLLELTKEKNGLGILKSQLFILSSKFSMLPCNLSVETHKRSLSMNTHLAMEAIIKEYKSKKLDDHYTISVLIEVNIELIKLYHYLKCPREVKSYGKEIFLLTQKLVLPIYSASYLMYLAHSDLLLHNRDNCQVKIRDMADVLSIDKASDEAGQSYSKQASPSSPSLRIQTFQIPSTAQHKSTCDCYYCDCYEYQKLVLEKMRLSALVNVKEKCTTVAQEFFKGAIQLYENYFKRSSKTRDFESELFSAYGYNLLNYSIHLWRIGYKDEAKSLNTKLQNLVKTKKLQNANLYKEVILQKLGYLNENIIPIPVPELLTDMDNLHVSDTNDLSRTPESKQSKVSFTIQHSQISPPPKIKVKKGIKFCYSPTELDNQKKTKVNDQIQTPRIHIFTEASEKKTRQRIRSNLAEKVQTPKLVITSHSEKKTRQKSTFVFQELPTPEPSSLSNSSVIDKSLRTRTQLLTEKLKKKIGSSISDIENQNITGCTKNPARKNLLKDLTDSDTDQKVVSNGAIRKSRRTKK